MNAQIRRFDNANALYYALANSLATAIEGFITPDRQPVLGLPTGNTMVPFYRIAADSELDLKVHLWHCFNLDEYYPITPANEALSFKRYMHTHFFQHLKKPPFRSEIINGSTHDPDSECRQYEEKIKAAGGIDIAILGIGVNGHIAFNEPGSSFESKTRAIELHPQTLMANFKGQAPFTHALTMGIGTLLDAKRIFVVALGQNKALAVKEALKDACTPDHPASALQKHPDVTWFLDQEAASLI
jgi:glucosamine-6-phosphate deaminase